MTTVTFRQSIFLEEHGDVDIEVTGYYEPDDPGNRRDDPGSPGGFEPQEWHYCAGRHDLAGTHDKALDDWIAANNSELWLAVEKQLDWESTP